MRYLPNSQHAQGKIISLVGAIRGVRLTHIHSN